MLRIRPSYVVAALQLLLSVACGRSDTGVAVNSGGGSTDAGVVNAGAGGALANAPQSCPAVDPLPDGYCNTDADCMAPFRSCVVATWLPGCLSLCSRGIETDICRSDRDCVEGLACGNVRPGSQVTGYCIQAGATTASCSSMDDCTAPNRCVELTAELSQCSTGMLAEPCATASDCQSNHCVDYRCESGLIKAACATDQDCDEGYCAPMSDIIGGPLLWACIEGSRSEACRSDEQCRDGFCVWRPSAIGLCSDGSLCRGHEQCDDGLCQERSHSWGTCSDYEARFCAADEQCAANTTCVAQPVTWGTCEPGQLLNPCFDDEDCQSGSCLRPDVGSSGQCADGSVGSPCGSDTSCTSGICVLHRPAEGSCSLGEPGEDCIDTEDCQSGDCMLQPGMALPGSCQP